YVHEIQELRWIDGRAHYSEQVPCPFLFLLRQGHTKFQLRRHLMTLVEIDRRVADRILSEHPKEDPVGDNLETSSDVYSCVPCDYCEFVFQFRVKGLQRIEQSAARSPGGLSDDDLPLPLVTFEFVHGNDGTLPRTSIPDHHEMPRKLYRI